MGAAHTKWMAEKKVFETAQKAHTEAMAAFTTAVNLEASNAHNACKNAHKQYNDLKNEVFNNVKSRKHVYIASLIIHCYVDNLKSNSAAKSCADKKRKSDTSMWNISANNLAACVSKAALQERFGPLSWKPSSKSCELKHWNERAHKEMQTKEKNTKESSKKEKDAKERATKKERSDKEKVSKEKLEKEKAREEKKNKAIEKDKKEKTSKEKAEKEKAAKAA